jgi:hypothetical protein
LRLTLVVERLSAALGDDVGDGLAWATAIARSSACIASPFDDARCHPEGEGR